MKWLFIDPIEWDYTPRTPLERPIGGSQSALCFLMMELARLGDEVVLINRTTSVGDYEGVRYYPLDQVPIDIKQPADACVVLNGVALEGPYLRSQLHPDTPLVCWNQIAHDTTTDNAGYADRAARESWHRIVCVSEWHREMMIRHCWLEPERTEVMRNAIGPNFEKLFASPEEMVDAKSAGLRLAYTSTPFRGLNVLLPVFARVRERYPAVELDVFSSLQVYQQSSKPDRYRALYDECRKLKGVTYRGSWPQPALSQALRCAAILSYPSIFAETSCIAVMEAMAAGLFAVTTDLGALVETTLGLGSLEPMHAEQGPVALAQRYAIRLAEAIEVYYRDPAAWIRARWPQVERMNAEFTWRCRAHQWRRLVESWRN